MLPVGQAELLHPFAHNGKRKVALFGLGNMCPLANKTAIQLIAEGYDVAVINPRFSKPIDAATHEQFARTADVLVTMEDHVLMGGYGSAVLELLNEKNISTPLVRIGWPDQFIEHASTQDELRKKYGLTPEHTVARVKAHFADAPATRKLAAAV
jgi:1-deoxy-D-xylulose-5-phosphate synthase